jgi:hypothetical protein
VPKTTKKKRKEGKKKGLFVIFGTEWTHSDRSVTESDHLTMGKK